MLDTTEFSLWHSDIKKVSVDTAGTIYLNDIALDTANATPTRRTGLKFWDEEHQTTSTYLKNGVTLQDGQELHLYCQNNSGSLIANGKAVYVVNAGGETRRIMLADNRYIFTSYTFIGVTTQSIAHGSSGYVTIFGEVHDMNTNGMTEGREIFLTTNGDWSQTKPTNAHVIRLGYVTYAHSSNGIILISADNCTLPHFAVFNNQATSR